MSGNKKIVIIAAILAGISFTLTLLLILLPMPEVLHTLLALAATSAVTMAGSLGLAALLSSLFSRERPRKNLAAGIITVAASTFIGAVAATLLLADFWYLTLPSDDSLIKAAGEDALLTPWVPTWLPEETKLETAWGAVTGRGVRGLRLDYGSEYFMAEEEEEDWMSTQIMERNTTFAIREGADRLTSPAGVKVTLTNSDYVPQYYFSTGDVHFRISSDLSEADVLRMIDSFERFHETKTRQSTLSQRFAATFGAWPDGPWLFEEPGYMDPSEKVKDGIISSGFLGGPSLRPALIPLGMDYIAEFDEYSINPVIPVKARKLQLTDEDAYDTRVWGSLCDDSAPYLVIQTLDIWEDEPLESNMVVRGFPARLVKDKQSHKLTIWLEDEVLSLQSDMGKAKLLEVAESLSDASPLEEFVTDVPVAGLSQNAHFAVKVPSYLPSGVKLSTSGIFTASCGKGSIIEYESAQTRRESSDARAYMYLSIEQGHPLDVGHTGKHRTVRLNSGKAKLFPGESFEDGSVIEFPVDEHLSVSIFGEGMSESQLIRVANSLK